MHVLLVGAASESYRRVGRHSHEAWEIMYCCSGAGTLRLGDEDIGFRQGDIICQPPGIPHSASSRCGFRDVFVLAAGFDAWGTDRLVFKGCSGALIEGLFMQMHNEFHLKQSNWSGIVDSLFGVLYQYVVSWSLHSGRNPLVAQMENKIIENITNPNFEIKKELSRLPLSGDYFRKLFQKETGRTPLQYLTEKRIEYAKTMLRTRSASMLRIKEIASLAGFEDMYYFSRVFKKYEGQSPISYLKSGPDV